MRISDWSSDVCSSDLGPAQRRRPALSQRFRDRAQPGGTQGRGQLHLRPPVESAWRAHRRLHGDGRRDDGAAVRLAAAGSERSEEHTSELQSLMRISYAVFCSKKKKYTQITETEYN